MSILRESISRRGFMKTAAGAGTTFLLLPYTGCKVTETAVPGMFLTKEQQNAARALANVLLPTDDLPGGGDLGIVAYLEQLLTAFDSETPRIFAAGPYSGRNPFTTIFPGEATTQDIRDDFKDFVPLTRAQEAAWRLYLYGSDGVAGGGPNDAVTGKITGLRTLIPAGLNKAIKLSPGPIDKIPQAGLDVLLRLLDADFWKAFSDLAIESAFAAPEYGGNQQLLGWKIARFAGDVHPWGYTFYDESTGTYHERPEAPVSSADPGPDPEPFTEEVRLLLDAVSLIKGKIFKLKGTAIDTQAVQSAAMEGSK